MAKRQKISIEMARIIAKICGDGNLSKRYIRYNNTCQDLLDEFCDDVKKEFGAVHLIFGKGNSGTSFVQIQDKRCLNLLRHTLKSYKSKDIKIPKLILNASTNIKKEFIRAFFDDEGCANLRINQKTKEWKRNVEISSKAFIFLKSIKHILENEFGIKTNRIIKFSKKDPLKFCYKLSITGKDNIEKFKKDIGFKHPKKQKILELMISSWKAGFCRENTNFKVLYSKLKGIKSQSI